MFTMEGKFNTKNASEGGIVTVVVAIFESCKNLIGELQEHDEARTKNRSTESLDSRLYRSDTI